MGYHRQERCPKSACSCTCRSMDTISSSTHPPYFGTQMAISGLRSSSTTLLSFGKRNKALSISYKRFGNCIPSKFNWQGFKYHVAVSMPGYIAKLLRKVRPDGVKPAHTPGVYHPPYYKSPQAQTATIDSSPLASKSQQQELQVVVGTLLYYARTFDPSILTAVHELCSIQSQPTLQDIQKVKRLLQYVSSHQNGATRYYGSTMQLEVQSDASYLCHPKARSVLGGFHYLGFPDRINGPMFCTSKTISCAVASMAEAELGAAFQNAQKAAEFRNTSIKTILCLDSGQSRF